MAGGRASTLLIRILGDSSGATRALNQVAQVEAATAAAVQDANQEIVASTAAVVTALEAEQRAEMEVLRMNRISAEVAEQAAKDQLQAARNQLATMKLQQRATNDVTEETRELIVAQEIVVQTTKEHSEAMARNVASAKLNIEALDRLQTEEKELAATQALTEDSSKKSAAALGKYGAIAAAAAAGLTILAKSASDVQQSFGSLDAIWNQSATTGQDMSDEMVEWSKTMSEYGISTAQAAQAASVLGAQLMNAGVPMEEAAVATQELIELSADMALAFNTTIPQALTAVTAAFRGEFEPLEKYGVGLSMAAVEAEILADEAAGVTYETERQAKVYAIYDIIMRETVAIQQQMENESETLAAQTNRLTAETKDLTAKLGAGLLPVFAPLIGALADTVAVTSDLIDENGALATVSETLVTILDGLWTIIEPILIPAIEALNTVLDALARFIDTYVNPVLEKLADWFDTIATAIENVVEWVQNLIDKLQELWDDITFWNDTNTTPAAATALIGAVNAVNGLRMPRLNGLGVNATAKQEPSINITVQAGVGDPHAIAREIRRVLHSDMKRMGRVAA